jgi:hypothetical protein
MNQMNTNTSQMQYHPTTNAPPRNFPAATAPRNERRHQINIESTFDADIVLRKVIEDRSSILTLKGRAAANEAELMKAR